MVGVEDLPSKVGPGRFPDAQRGELVKYGTSLPLAWVMNPAYDVLIAYEATANPSSPTAATRSGSSSPDTLVAA